MSKTQKRITELVQKSVAASMDSGVIDDMVREQVEGMIRMAVHNLLDCDGYRMRSGSPVLAALKPRVMAYVEELAAKTTVKLTREEERSLQEEIKREVGEALYAVLYERTMDGESAAVHTIEKRLDAMVDRMLKKEFGDEV